MITDAMPTSLPARACGRKSITATLVAVWLALFSGRDHGFARPAASRLSGNDHTIQHQLATPDTPGLAALKRTVQACCSGRTAGAHTLGQRNAARIVGEEQLGRLAARQSLAGAADPLRGPPSQVTSPSVWLDAVPSGHLSRNV
jgi:hypothetical protein